MEAQGETERELELACQSEEDTQEAEQLSLLEMAGQRMEARGDAELELALQMSASSTGEAQSPKRGRRLVGGAGPSGEKACPVNQCMPCGESVGEMEEEEQLQRALRQSMGMDSDDSD